MKRFTLLLMVLISMSVFSYAKDINAWKNENNIEQQYLVFKENLNYWNGNYFLNETQLDEFHTAFNDSVTDLKEEIAVKANKINSLQNDINSINRQLENTNAELDTSIKNQNAIEVFGLLINKSIYTLIMSLLILALMVVMGIVYQLYKRSHKVTVRAKKDYTDLKEEFEKHKKFALDRYTKLNTELHHTRMELKRR